MQFANLNKEKGKIFINVSVLCRDLFASLSDTVSEFGSWWLITLIAASRFVDSLSRRICKVQSRVDLQYFATLKLDHEV